MQKHQKTKRNLAPHQEDSECCRERKPNRPPAARYIVERIISIRKQQLFFKGKLELLKLQPNACMPLSLCDAKVISIQPCCSEECGYIRLKVVLLLQLSDGRGCLFCHNASFEVRALSDAPALQDGINLRRGASIHIDQAAFCPPCSFDVCLKMMLHTVASCSECCENMDCSCREDLAIPLYPQPCVPHRRRKC